MRENELFALVRSTLIADPRLAGVAVVRRSPDLNVGMPASAALYLQAVTSRRYGFLGRREVLDPGGAAFTQVETQQWETTLQVSGTVRRTTAGDALLTAEDYCAIASDVLQSDVGRAALAAGGARPLRITDLRTVFFINDATQYEASPSFDVVLCHVQINQSAVPAVSQIVPDVENAGP